MGADARLWKSARQQTLPLPYGSIIRPENLVVYDGIILLKWGFYGD
jgi:hypothetical protein